MQAKLNETPFIQITALPHDQLEQILVVGAQHPDLAIPRIAVVTRARTA